MQKKKKRKRQKRKNLCALFHFRLCRHFWRDRRFNADDWRTKIKINVQQKQNVDQTRKKEKNEIPLMTKKKEDGIKTWWLK